MITNTLATLTLVHLLERLKESQDNEDGLFLSGTVDAIISEYEKLKEIDPTLLELYNSYKEEGFNFDKIR